MPDCTIDIRVTPRSTQNKIKVVDDRLKLWTTASPTDGQANAAACAIVADKLDIAKTRVSVIKGHTIREKRLKIEGLDLKEALQRLSK